MVPLTHRNRAYAMLSGRGLEIGAFNEPAPLPPGASVEYLDAVDPEKAAKLFPEVKREKLVRVTYIGDLDQDGLAPFPESAFDFVVINHVLEHVANPVKAVREVFRICRRGGIVVIAIPDKEYTFDRGRELTSWEHLWSDYQNDVRVSSDEHYESFLRSAAPHVFREPPENLKVHVQLSRNRREHAHVWTSASFQRFLESCFQGLGIRAELLYASEAAQNQIEYFSAWARR
jgi:SAM-dependent methyltransferase